MELNKKLFSELVNLREKLKEKASRNGKFFSCTDSVLEQIATYLPKKLTDFESISGVGPVFIENYSQYFIEKVKAFTENPEDEVKLNKRGVTILQDYEKKLVNLNKRNHLLYCPKLYNSFAVDLAHAVNDIRNIILGTGRAATICRFEDANYKPVVSLLRSNNRNLREKGQNNLFVAYPFVKGKFGEEDFTVRAPLALFPIKGERSSSGIKLVLDREREVLYNTTLILANYKFKKINKPLPDNSVEDTSRDTFIDSLLDFYKQNDFSIERGKVNSNREEIEVFENYKSDTFPEFKNGEFVLEHSAVFGIFPITSSSIQKDFQRITESRKINKLLDDLLENKDYEPFDWKNPKDISEKQLNYINSLDAAQENVIAALESTDELVVQGPPGTGKSQTITSLIANYAIKNKSVLLVSEKKTALDVVYSRLGNLSKYALILDDVNDKASFYAQLEEMVKLEEKPEVWNEMGENLDRKIDQDFDGFRNIQKGFFEKDEFGIEPYKLYLVSDVQEILKKENLKKIRELEEKAGLFVKDFKYDDVIEAKRFYADEQNLSLVKSFVELNRKYNWLEKTKNHLTDFEIQSAAIDIEKIFEDSEKREKLNFVKKCFSKNEVKLDLEDFCRKYFELKTEEKSKIKKLVKRFYKDLKAFEEGFEKYSEYWKASEFYETISANLKIFYSALETIAPKLDNVNEVVEEICFFICARHLIALEAKNREMFQDLDETERIIKSLDESISKKRDFNRQVMEKILSDKAVMLSKSKRRSEILKAVEAKRKWSVNRFVNKFNFELYNSVKIWLLTPEVVSELIPLETGFFDLVVFDEASQMYVEKGLPSILRGKQVVIAGDQKQLRPTNMFNGRFTVDEDDEEDSLCIASDEDSLLDLARFKYDKVLLNFHYRSAYEELIAYSNYAFYDGRLYVSPNTEKPELAPIEVHKMENALWTNRANEAEARFTVQLIKKFFAERRHNETIGVITFNTNQRDAIDDLLDKECENDSEFAAVYEAELTRKRDGQDIGLFVKNIETVQGDERDVIIFSMGYAKNDEGKFIQNFGWLNQTGGENRLNVAVSRARQKIHIVVSFEPDELKTDGAKNKGPEALKKYLNYAFAVSSGNKDRQKQILDELVKKNVQQQMEAAVEEAKGLVVVDEVLEQSKDAEKTIQEGMYNFKREVERVLADHGYDFERNVGLGGYTIDFGIMDAGKFVLGVECDWPLYEGSSTVRERDYYRQKYLESRGWNIYRLWSVMWKKDPAKAQKKLIEAIESRI